MSWPKPHNEGRIPMITGSVPGGRCCDEIRKFRQRCIFFMDGDVQGPLHGVNSFLLFGAENLNVGKRLVSVYQGI